MVRLRVNLGSMVATAYDRVRYPGLTFAQTHPTATGVFAALFGRRFAPFGASRVLEIGCGEGVNLINMALGAPQAEFVGVDLAAEPVARARATARSCSLANVSFHVRDLVDMGASFGQFDYIVAHGVYAWVRARVRDAILRVVSERLSADGLALISYNALPGSRIREAIRDMLLYVTKGVEDPKAKLDLARSFLAEQIEAWSDAEADESAMKSEARRLLDRRPGVLYHDELADSYAPQLLSDVAGAAAKFGLAYLCDAQPHLSEEALFPSDAYAATRERSGGDWVRFEQLADFRAMRRFHYSIFTLGAGADRRREAARLRGLWACAELTVDEADAKAPDGAVFQTGHGVKLTTNDPALAQFLATLGQVFPLGAPLDRACESPPLADHIFRLFARQAIQLSTAQTPLVTVPGERPKVSALARVQAAAGEKLLATLRHVMIQIDDPFVRALIPLIGGTRTRGELALEIARRNDVSVAAASAQLGEILTKLARAGLMAG
jgi:SAM-dependent methyltransferase